jgi:hypothetical protein
MGTRRRVDDRTAIIDWVLAHGFLFGALIVAALAIAMPSMRGALRGALLVGAVATVRLYFHPLRFARLSRVWIERGQVMVASAIGSPRAVNVVRVEHDGHAPWPCVLHLEDGTSAHFVARRDSGYPALLDLEPSDRARYERPSDARDSITDLQMMTRK